MFTSDVRNCSAIRNKALSVNTISNLNSLTAVQRQDTSFDVIEVKEVAEFEQALVSLKKTEMKATLELIGQEVIYETLKALPPDIQHLKLSASALSEDVFNLKQLATPNLIRNFKELKSLAINETLLPASLFIAILANTPNLTSLTLDSCNVQSATEYKKLSLLEKLEDLSLNDSQLPAELFGALLESACKVRKLSLKDCNALNAEKEWKLPCFEQLEDLSLCHPQLGGGFLRALLICAPNLTSLKLNHWNGFNAASTSELTSLDLSSSSILGRWVLPPLKKLISLNLSHSSFPDSFLTKILASAPDLTNLYLSECRGFARQGFTIAKLPPLKKLAFLKLRGTEFSKAFFKAILTSAPKLTALDAEWQRVVNAADPSELGNLEKLVVLKSAKLHITPGTTLA